MTKRQSDGIRVTLDLTREAHSRLGALVSMLDVRSKTQAVQLALQYFEFIVHTANEGAYIKIRERSGEDHVVNWLAPWSGPQVRPSAKPAVPSRTNKVRITIDFSQVRNERLENLEATMRSTLGVSGKANVLRLALQALEFIIHQSRDGSSFVLVQGDAERPINWLAPDPRATIAPSKTARDQRANRY